MAVKPVRDHGQELSTPNRQALGFVDTEEQFEAVTKALTAAGYAESDIVALNGEDGIDMLTRLQETFSIVDVEDALMAFPITEVLAAHSA